MLIMVILKMSFNADFTITLGQLKKGLFFGDGYIYSGEVEKGGIGIPDSLYDKFTTY